MSSTVAAPTAGRRARQSLRDMALSLAVILGIVAVVLLFQERGGRAVKAVDTAPVYAGARHVAAFPVRTPAGLPTGWRPTSARIERSDSGRVTLRVGFVTPAGRYAQLVEADLSRGQLLGQELAAGVRPVGSVRVGATTWQRFPGAQAGDSAIVTTEKGVTFIVSGSAGLGELEMLAESLR